MPTTVAEAFAAVGLSPEGVVRWGETPKVSATGVYIVSLTKSLGAHHNKLISAPLAPAEFEHWLGACPSLTLDGVRPEKQQLMARIQRFWLPDEVILYIGRA
jgi:hypothetical protein